MAESFNSKKSFDADYRIGFFSRNLTKPTPGKFYVVEKYAWLDSISFAAYGYDRVSDIIQANEFLQKREIEQNSGLPYIHPNDNIFIPDEILPKTPDAIDADDPEEIAIRIDGKVFKGFESNSIQRNLDTVADAFTFTAPLDPDSDSFAYLEPYTYLKAELFIGGELYLTGTLEKWKPSVTTDKSETTIEARSLSGVIVDCQSTNNSLVHSGTLRQISDLLLKDFGLSVSLPDGEGSNIPKAKRDLTSSLFSFLQKICKDQGFLITSDVLGNPEILKAAINEPSVQNLELGVKPVLSMSVDYDGTKRFSDITANSQTAGKPGITYTVQDPSLTVYRPRIVTAQSANDESIEQAAKWELSKTLTSSIVNVTVKGLRNEAVNLWSENMKVKLKADRIHIYRFTDYIIKNVSFTKSEDGGNIANFQCVLPESFTGEFPKVLPWVR